MSLEIIVANRHRMPKVENAAVVYVGRGTPLGNPATHEARWLKPGMVLAESREAAVEWFRRDLWQKMQDDTAELRELTRLAAIAREKKLVLQCSCAPLRCHAEVVKRAVEYLLRRPPGQRTEQIPGLKVIVAGSRTVSDVNVVAGAIRASEFEVAEVVSGCARGVDQLGAAPRART
jgi:hypothetical protein